MKQISEIKSENITNSSTDYLLAYQTEWLTYEGGGVSDGQHVPHDGGEDGDGQHDGDSWVVYLYNPLLCK